ncbi:MAG: hypothetical protein ACK6BG_10865 [Cyanobacteriota bacterium]
MPFEELAKKVLRKTREVFPSRRTRLDEKQFKHLADDYDFNGYKRIYLVHIRKTGGTSLNHMFLSLSGADSRQLYSQLAKVPDHRLCSHGKIYVGWNGKYINKGVYFYAFSHLPFHQLSLPEKTFSVSCFRDPVKRVVSHYNMLMELVLNKSDHPCLHTEAKWLGSNFNDFLSRMPKEHLLNQLYMFSSSFDVGEAVANVRRLSCSFMSENFNEGIDELNEKTGLSLKPIHIRKAGYQAKISGESLAKLKELLRDEYRFLEGIRETQNP